MIETTALMPFLVAFFAVAAVAVAVAVAAVVLTVRDARRDAAVVTLRRGTTRADVTRAA